MARDDGDSGSELTLEGTLERVVFQNPTTQWTVARFVPEGAIMAVTVVGALLGVDEGTPLRLRGVWIDDKKFGRQFKIGSYQTRSPATVAGIERYLGSGLIEGIGPELARRIVARFGMDTLDVIDKDVGRLREVEGIGAARAEKIAAAWTSQREIQDVMVFLRGLGVSAAYAVRIYKKYGREAIGKVRQNPYRLALDVWGIGFKTADSIARSLGISPTAPERLEAGLLHGLEIQGEDGHVHVPEAPLAEATAELLAVDAALLPSALDRLELSGLIVRESLGDRGKCASLASLWREEHDAAACFAELVAAPLRPARFDLDGALRAFEQATGLELAPQQRRAVEASMADKCVVITGGPGVGKTTIVRAMVTMASGAQRRVALAAPTGRAAKRLTESTGFEALTLHRLLEFQPQGGGFARRRGNPLDVEVVIVDEVSMVDIALFHALLEALRPSAQLVLVGDVDQLPSVGPGAVLADVIASGAATVVRLTEIFRQAAASQIIVNAHRVNEGVVPALSPPAPAPGGAEAPRSDFYFIERADPVAARDTIVELVAERIPARFGLDPVGDVQVLTPMHRGELGTAALNLALQARLNPPGEGGAELGRGDRAFRVGDKVMQLRNDYEKAVFNGDIGVVREVLVEAGKLIVELPDGRSASYERAELDQLVHAFAVSVHKSQGSEYAAVVLAITTQHYMMLQRNLLYTAITRGKKLVVLVGSKKAVAMAVENDATKTRWTWLAERIRDLTAAADLG